MISFLYALQQLPPAPVFQNREETPRRQNTDIPEGVRIHEEPGRLVREPTQPAPEGPASRNFLLY
jgi:hypothetical protein